MGSEASSYIDYGKYQASLEDLSFRNRSILLWFSFGIIWLFLNIFVFNILWFWEEFYFAISEAGWQVVTENSDGTQCVVTEYESCERLVGAGGVWWSLLGSLTTGIAVGPLVFSALILSYRNKDVTKKWKDEIWGLLFLINPSIIWALLFLICLPYAWTLLPWGEWSTNWWKIFPYGFGLIWLGGLPPILAISQFFRKFFNREYNYDLTVEAEHADDDENHRTQEMLEESQSIFTSRNGMPQSHACKISILEATAGKPIRFNVNNRPSGNEAWFGLYPERATDQEHGGNWRYFRDVAHQNTLYLPPAQSAGRWGIRVFSDGGYNQIDRLDFDISGSVVQGSAAQLHPADGRYELAPEELFWNEHNDRARAMGGHLVSITSAEENELVARIAGERTVWIGGMRKGSGNGPGADHWCWCDGQPWIYANWAPGEPNNHGGNENRIQLYGPNKLWNDVGEGWRGPAVYQLTGKKSNQSAKKIQSALKQSREEKKDNFWDSV